ncbi:MAG TPA: MXAN_5187 C-terminal domain-containing protein, partial [Vicinamibacterales bacterium]|nr:MXAN_5187 C-terminal domain-containing protein [Vicinamibacterales bacterium]
HYDRAFIQNYGDRFRFSTLQARYATFIDLWDRGMRAREEGRPGPFGPKRPAVEPETKRPEDRILHVAAFRDPVREIDKLTELYESLAEARREVGEEAVPFHKFAELIKSQVKKLRDTGSPEVAFRVAVKDGKVNLTARALKGVKE